MTSGAGPAPPPLWQRAPLLPLALGWTLGVAVTPWLAGSGRRVFLVAGLALGAAALAVVAGRDRVATALLLGAIVGLAGLRATPLPPPPDHVATLSLPARLLVEGRLVEEPRRWSADRQRILLELTGVGDGETWRATTGLVQLNLYGEAPPLGEGQGVQALARLARPVAFRNPGGFDYPAHLARAGILVVGTARADHVVTLTGDAPPWPVRVRRWTVRTFAEHLPPASAALLAGLLLGERSQLPTEQDESFRAAGVYHILAVSGFNVALVVGAVFGALALLGVPRRAAAMVAAAALIGFALVVGAQPSVVRASVMGLALLAAVILERESQLANALALAALVLLVWRPGDLHEPGFQLSFAATAGIVWLAPDLDAALQTWGLRPWLAGAVAVSVAAQLAVTPIMLAHFNQLSLIGVAANVVVVPLAGAATVLGLLAVAVAAGTATAAGWLLHTVWLLLLALRAAVALAAAMPAAMVHLPAPPAPAIAAWTTALLLIPHAGRRAARWVIVGLVVAAGALAVWPWLRPDDGRLRVTFVDVGQGDAALVEVPGGAAVLVDTGVGGPGRFDVGERVLAPFLWNRPRQALTAVAISHADPDHAGALPTVLRRFRVAEVWSGAHGGAGGEEARRLIACANIRHRVVAAPTRLVLGDATFTVLHPDDDPLPGTNENSLVLRLEWRGFTVLLTGDLGGPGERRVLARAAPVRADVLKVGHHGSRFSSTAPFLEAVDPAVGVISVGARNPFGHPTPAALARLDAAGARVYRTDRDGAVLLETDGRILWITRWATGGTERIELDRPVGAAVMGAAPGPSRTEALGGHPRASAGRAGNGRG